MSKEMAEICEANSFLSCNVWKILYVSVKMSRYADFEMSKICPNI